MKKTIVTFILFFSAYSLFSQNKQFAEIKELYEKSNYEKCIEKAENLLEKNPKEAELATFAGLSYFQLFKKNTAIIEKEKNIKAALKLLQKAKTLSKTTKYIDAFQKEMQEVHDSLHQFSYKIYNSDKKEKAKPYYDLLAKIYNDTTLQYFELNNLPIDLRKTTTIKLTDILEEDYNQTDAQGKKQGKWKKVFPNGRTAYEVTFLNDKPIGEFKRYYENGKQSAILNYDNKSEYATAQLFNEDGLLISEGFYFANKKDSVWKLYSYNKNILNEMSELKDMALVNKKNLSYLAAEEHYKKGKKTGIWKKFYPDGLLAEEIQYQNDIENGIRRIYFPNGKPKEEMVYQNNKRNGMYKCFDIQGKIIKQGLYKNDLKEGKWLDEGMDGKPMEIEYIAGKAKNQDELDEKESKWIKNLDNNKDKLKDPEKFLNDPEKIIYDNGGN